MERLGEEEMNEDVSESSDGSDEEEGGSDESNSGGSGSTDSADDDGDGSSDSDEDEPVLKYKRFAKEVVSSNERGIEVHICTIAVHSKVKVSLNNLVCIK